MIGAGTAGGVIAKELTDDKSTSVLVLEAGTNMTNELSNPSVLAAINTTRGNRFSFNVTSELESTIARTLIATNGRAIGEVQKLVTCTPYVAVKSCIISGQVLLVINGVTTRLAPYL
ncbi:hypothetical protein AAHB51_29960 [Bacillus cereus]